METGLDRSDASKNPSKIVCSKTGFQLFPGLANTRYFLCLLAVFAANPLWAADCFETLQITLSSQSDVDNFQAVYGQGGVCDTLKSALIISGNDIANLDGLTDITSTNRNLEIQYNPLLKDVAGLSGLQVASAGLTIRENDALEQVDGLSALHTVGSLNIVTNPKLMSLSGLDNLVTANFIQISDNPGLGSLNGLGALESVQTTLQLTSLNSLTSLDGLSSLFQVGGALLINENPMLQNLDGLSPLQAAGYVIIRGNEALADLDGLSNVDASLSALEIENNPVLENLHGLGGIAGAVSGNLRIVNNDSLIDLAGLQGLTSAGILRITDNDNLLNIDALTNLVEAGLIDISSNPLLTTIGGIANIVGIVDSINISSNPQLTDIAALAGIEGPLTELRLSGNSLIQDVDGLIGITGANSVNITDNASLANLNGLASLVSVGDPVFSFGGALVVRSNSNLDNCVGLIPVLDDIDDGEPGPRLAGLDGPPDVELFSIIQGNGQNCNSAETILAYSVSSGLAVAKVYSNNDYRPVKVSLECELATVLITAIEDKAAPGTPAQFSMKRFVPGFKSNCTASEPLVPEGYLADNSGCVNLQLQDGAQLDCEIRNHTVASSVTIEKFYTHTEPPQFPEVFVTLTCPNGQVLPAETQKTTSGIAMFEVVNYDFTGETCSATEHVRAGYLQVGNDGCESLEVGFSVTSNCSFTNEIDPEIVFPDGFETW